MAAAEMAQALLAQGAMRPVCLTLIMLIGLIALTAARSWAAGQSSTPKSSTPKSSTPKSSTPTIGELYYFRMQTKLKSRANIRRVKPGTVKPRVVKPPPKAPVRRVQSSRPRASRVVRKLQPQMKKHSTGTFLVLGKALVGHPGRRASSRVHEAPGHQDGRTAERAVRIDLDTSVQHRKEPAGKSGIRVRKAGSSVPGKAVVAPSTLKRLQLQFELLQMGDSLQ